MSTTAVKDGDGWIINGAKNFITHAISGDIAVVMTRTGEKGQKIIPPLLFWKKEWLVLLPGKKKTN
jgi:alkylation response protein AidB-like acyl-CoA dehydrogenase